METDKRIPAAEYLRMSTEHQQYSLDNQQAAIRDYAERNGFTVIQTYSDAGKSGLLLKRRDGLKQLLNEVVSGEAQFKAILVYDVSRWGRFQDADEAAHYEFLCKAAGICIHYCAEQFVNDDSFTSSIMKTLKRVMAAEYSRELSVKVHDGVKRVSEAGFRHGGIAGYGLRRMLVSSNREPKSVLSMGEKKAIQSDRVILVPGPQNEVQHVREIFRLFTQEQQWPAAIAAKLRRERVAYPGFKRTAWYSQAVNRILKNPKYSGCSVFGQSTTILQTIRTHNPRQLWTVTKGAWEPIVDQDTFDEAQKRFADQTIFKTDEDLLLKLRHLLEERGSLSEKLFNQMRNLPSVRPYTRRFGSLSEAFERVGYIGKRLASTKTRRTVRALRRGLIKEVFETNTSQIAVVQPNGHYRASLLACGVPVAVYMCRSFLSKHGIIEWILDSVPREQSWIAILIRLQPGNEAIMDFFVVPDTQAQTRYTLTFDDPWLRRGIKPGKVADCLAAIRQIQERRTSVQQE